MKAADAFAASKLTAALGDFEFFLETLEREEPEHGYDWLGLVIRVESICAHGGSGYNGIDLPMSVARKIAPLIRTAIINELKLLGVEVEGVE